MGRPARSAQGPLKEDDQAPDSAFFPPTALCRTASGRTAPSWLDCRHGRPRARPRLRRDLRRLNSHGALGPPARPGRPCAGHRQPEEGRAVALWIEARTGRSLGVDRRAERTLAGRRCRGEPRSARARRSMVPAGVRLPAAADRRAGGSRVSLVRTQPLAFPSLRRPARVPGTRLRLRVT